MTKGKVVLVPFPFDDLSATKVRPAVCLTEPIGPHRHVILAFITSRIPAALLDTDLVLDAGHAHFASTPPVPRLRERAVGYQPAPPLSDAMAASA
jgi:mRNA interferase MazF